MDDAAVFLITVVALWQVYSYYNVDIKEESLDFKQETLMSDLILENNYNYISLLNTFFLAIFLNNFSGIFFHTLFLKIVRFLKFEIHVKSFTPAKTWIAWKSIKTVKNVDYDMFCIA